MNIKKWLFNDESDCSQSNRKHEKNEKTEVSTITYSELLGLNRQFSFIRLRKKAENESEFEEVKKASIDILKQDLMRLGETFYQVEAALRNKLMGSIGSMVIVADKNGNIAIRFHKRDEDGIWDNGSKKYPEKGITSEENNTKFKTEIFFTLEDDEDE